jgi:soluble P-type ATPase
MTYEIVALLSALGIGGAIQAIVSAYMNRRVTAADATVKIVAASGDFTNTVLQRLAVVEAKVAALEAERELLRRQIFDLGHTPVVVQREEK